MGRIKLLLSARRVILALSVTMLSLTGFTMHPVSVLAAGNTYTVNTTQDTLDIDPTNGVCADINGKCSLRGAIMEANFHAGADTVILPAGVDLLTRPGEDDTALIGDLDITDDLTIQGAGSSATIVDGNGAVTGDRVFQILPSAKVVSISGLAIRNGKKITNTFDSGGGLDWEGNGSHLTLNDVIIENNSARYGGGLYLVYSGSGDILSFDHLVLHANTATTGSGGGLAANFGDFASFDLHASQVYSNTAYEGGGLYFQGAPTFGLSSVHIENTDIYSNTASLNAGMENLSGNATVPVVMQNSNLHHNRAAFYGGAIGNSGYLDIFTTTLDANTAALRGGGLYDYEPGKVNIVQSTFSRNSSQTGGGIYSEFFSHNTTVLTLTNSTLSGNIASQDGAGIFADGGLVNLYNATIASNQIQASVGMTYNGQGGGIYIVPGVLVAPANTVIADNTHRYQLQSPVPDDCFGILDSLGHNLIESTSGCSIAGITTGNITGQDPGLGILQSNGGPALTQLPSPGSPAIDNGQTPNCTTIIGTPILTDQRGIPRPLGSGCDIGALETFPVISFLPDVQK